MNRSQRDGATPPTGPLQVVYDRGTGYLAVTLEVLPHLGVLVSGARGMAQLPAAVADALVEAGAVEPDGEVAPLVSAVAEVVDRTFVEIDIELATAVGLAVAVALVSTVGGIVAFPAAARSADDPDAVVPTDDPALAELVLTPAAEVPYRIGDLLDIGARPHTEAVAVTLPTGVIDDLLATDPDEALAAVDEVFSDPAVMSAEARAALGGLLRSARARWSVTARVAIDDHEVVERRHEVIDAGAVGWWFVLRDERFEVLAPTTGREVVEALESLLPTCEDLDGFVTDRDGPAAGHPDSTPTWTADPRACTPTPAD